MKPRIGRPLAIVLGLSILSVVALLGVRPAGPARLVHAQTGPCANSTQESDNCGHQRRQPNHTPAAPAVVAPQPRTPVATGQTWFANDTTDADSVASPSRTTCGSSGNTACTLRDAVILADADAQDTINLKPSSTYTLTIAPGGSACGAGNDFECPNEGALKILSSMTLTGAGAASTIIDGHCASGCTDRVFEVVNKDAANSVSFNGLTIQHGAPVKVSAGPTSDFPGCVTNAGASGGGGILIDSFITSGTPGNTTTTGPVALNGVTLTNNAATANLFNPRLSSCTKGDGGGVRLLGFSSLSLANTTLDSNRAGSGGGGLGMGSASTTQSGTLTMTNTTISNNTATDGGGLHVDVGETRTPRVPVVLQGVTVTGNKAGASGGEGGGIHLSTCGAALSISNSTLTNNQVNNNNDAGGAIFVSCGSLTVSGTTISGNTAGNDGGAGIYADTCSPVSVSNSRITNNSASGGTRSDGAAFRVNCSRANDTDPLHAPALLTIDGTTISGNAADDSIIEDTGYSITITGSTITGNTYRTADPTPSSNTEGLIAVEREPNETTAVTLTISNSTIANNTGPGTNKHTIRLEGASGNIQLSTIAGNSSGGLLGVADQEAGTVGSAFTLEGTILAQNGANCIVDARSSIATQGGNVADDASCNLNGPNDLQNTNPKLGLLAGNGGPTQTMALQSGSPAVDNVPGGLCPPPATDQRGVSRPLGTACDSGAFESSFSRGGGPTFIIQPGPVGTPSVTPTRTPTPAPGTTTTPTPTLTPGCATVTYAAGYNLAGGPTGTALTGAAALFTHQASDPVSGPAFYRAAGNTLTAPQGVWAFYFSPKAITQPCVSGTSTTVSLPAGNYVMVGNPFNRPATITGSTTPTWAITFNTATNTFGTWTQVGPGNSMALAVGQGAFVFASGGGALTITST